ncbi:MAG: universal stress protein [Desulfomonilaceae bacterium]|nr:universal stress protein [Desulfomonilaceae bacterium]
MIPKRILVCTDFSENSVPARVLAIEYAKVFGAELDILHVVNSRLLGYPDFATRIPQEYALVEAQIQEGVNEELELIGNDCRREIDQVRIHSRTGSPIEEIVKFADEEKVGLIVMGTHGWTGARLLILGSIAENVVRQAQCPVLTVKPGNAS